MYFDILMASGDFSNVFFNIVLPHFCSFYRVLLKVSNIFSEFWTLNFQWPEMLKLEVMQPKKIQNTDSPSSYDKKRRFREKIRLFYIFYCLVASFLCCTWLRCTQTLTFGFKFHFNSQSNLQWKHQLPDLRRIKTKY